MSQIAVITASNPPNFVGNKKNSSVLALFFFLFKIFSNVTLSSLTYRAIYTKSEQHKEK
jgi:hypothetical protein